MEKKPEDRYGSAKELAEVLEAATGGEKPEARRVRLSGWGLGLLGLLAVGVAVVLVTGLATDPDATGPSRGPGSVA